MRNFLVVMLAVAFTARFTAAAESQAEQEAKQAAAEDAAEKLLPEDQQFGKSYSGTFTLLNSDLQKSPVVGTFAIDGGATYQVKLTDPGILKRLTLYDNKRCMLFGKIRNEGKYLIATSIVESQSAPPVRRKRGGL